MRRRWSTEYQNIEANLVFKYHLQYIALRVDILLVFVSIDSEIARIRGETAREVNKEDCCMTVTIQELSEWKKIPFNTSSLNLRTKRFENKNI